MLGLDPRPTASGCAQLVGVQLQESELPEQMTVARGARPVRLVLRGPGRLARGCIDDLGLADKRDTAFAKLSGGQKQRLSIALALVGNPRIAVLDELTTGLDPQARRDTWELIEDIRDRGVTVLLVTHFMEEAERLCDRIAVIDPGRVVALDTPAGIVSGWAAEQGVRFRPSVAARRRLLTGLPEVRCVTRKARRWS